MNKIRSERLLRETNPFQLAKSRAGTESQTFGGRILVDEAETWAREQV